MPTNDPILAALRGEPAPTKITAPRHPAAEGLSTYPAMVFDALESTARERVRQMIAHEGASPVDAQALTNLDIRDAVTEAVNSGATDLDALDAARAVLEKANTRHRARPGKSRRVVAIAEATAAGFTPRLVRETRQEYTR